MLDHEAGVDVQDSDREVDQLEIALDELLLKYMAKIGKEDKSVTSDELVELTFDNVLNFVWCNDLDDIFTQ